MDFQVMGERLMSLAGGIAAIAVLAAFVWEAIKRLFPLRGHCHLSTLRIWLGDDQPSYTDLRELLGEEDVFALFNQPLPRLMAAIQGAATSIIEYPLRHKALYRFLTRVKKNVDTKPSDADTKPKRGDADTWRDYVIQLARKAEGRPPDADVPEVSETTALTARDNLERLVNRKLDAVQARCEYQWGRFNRTWILILAAAFFLGAGITIIDVLSWRAWFLLMVAAIVTALMAVLVEELLRGLSDRSAA